MAWPCACVSCGGVSCSPTICVLTLLGMAWPFAAASRGGVSCPLTLIGILISVGVSGFPAAAPADNAAGVPCVHALHAIVITPATHSVLTSIRSLLTFDARRASALGLFVTWKTVARRVLRGAAEPLNRDRSPGEKADNGLPVSAFAVGFRSILRGRN